MPTLLLDLILDIQLFYLKYELFKKYTKETMIE